MAKQIKAVQCPKCGSTDKKEIKPDYFHCNNCGTEYFLDNDDITINQNINNPNAPQSNPFGQLDRNKKLLIGGIIAFVLLAFLLPTLFSSPTQSNFSTPATNKDKEEKFWWGDKQTFFADPSGTPLMLIVGDKGDRRENEVPTLSIMNLETKKVIQTRKLSITAVKANEWSLNNEYDAYTFMGGSVYVIANEQEVFKLNQKDYTLEPLNGSLAASHTELSSGIAKATFSDYNDGQVITITNNENTEYSYYPIIDKMYTGDERRAIQDALWKNTSIENLVQVIQFFEYRDDKQFPEKLTSFYTPDDRTGPVLRQGVFQAQRIVSANPKIVSRQSGIKPNDEKDLTPGRKYFEPKMQYYDSNIAIITSNATPAKNAPVQLQAISTKTGAAVWTQPVGKEYVRQVYPYKDGLMIMFTNRIMLISWEGKQLLDFDGK